MPCCTDSHALRRDLVCVSYLLCSLRPFPVYFVLYYTPYQHQTHRLRSALDYVLPTMACTHYKMVLVHELLDPRKSQNMSTGYQTIPLLRSTKLYYFLVSRRSVRYCLPEVNRILFHLKQKRYGRTARALQLLSVLFCS